MSNGIENVTQSPMEIELNDGKTYKFGVVGFVDYGDFVQYIKGQKIKLCEYIEDKETRLQMVEKIMNEQPDLEKEYGTVNGIIYIAWKAIQKHQPDIKLSDMNNLIDLNNFEKVSIILNNLGGTVKNPKKAKTKK